MRHLQTCAMYKCTLGGAVYGKSFPHNDMFLRAELGDIAADLHLPEQVTPNSYKLKTLFHVEMQQVEGVPIPSLVCPVSPASFLFQLLFSSWSL